MKRVSRFALGVLGAAMIFGFGVGRMQATSAGKSAADAGTEAGGGRCGRGRESVCSATGAGTAAGDDGFGCE